MLTEGAIHARFMSRSPLRPFQPRRLCSCRACLQRRSHAAVPTRWVALPRSADDLGAAIVTLFPDVAAVEDRGKVVPTTDYVLQQVTCKGCGSDTR